MPTAPATDPVARNRALGHPSRVHLLELLRGSPDGLGVAELARRSGLHPNTVRAHLDKLRAAALVTGDPVKGGGRGRPSVRYRATDEPGQDPFRLLSSMLASALDTGDHDGPSPAAEHAGRRWGRHLAARTAGDAGALPPAPPDAVTGLFDDLGFAPTRERERIVLDACPYRELAARHPDVVCGLHLGMLRGALDAHGTAGDDAWLEPFVTPTRCVAGVPHHVPVPPDDEERR